MVEIKIRDALDYQRYSQLPAPERYERRVHPHPQEPRIFNTPKIKLPDPPTSLLSQRPSASDSMESRAELSAWLFAASGRISITLKELRKGDEKIRYTKEHYAYPSAGALFPVQIYLWCTGNFGLEGLYAYEPREHQLALLREGNFQKEIREWLRSGETPQMVVFFTVLYPRTALKYGGRSFRYVALDTGHALEAAQTASRHFRFPGKLFLQMDFVAVDRFLGLDSRQEECFAALTVGSFPAPGKSAEIVPANFSHSYSGSEKLFRERFPNYPYPEMEGIRRLCRPSNPAEYRSAPKAASIPSRDPSPVVPDDNLLRILEERQSSSDFVVGEPLSREHLFAALFSTHPAENNVFSGDLLSAYLLVHQVPGMEPGLYAFPGGEPVILKKGDFRHAGFRLALNQGLGGSGGALIMLTADLRELSGQLGTDALRLAYLEAGRLGQHYYQAAAQLDFGICGIGAFRDGDILRFLELDSRSHGVLYLLGMGYGASDSYRWAERIVYRDGHTRTLAEVRESGY